MSNLENNVHYKPPVNFCQENQQHSQKNLHDINEKVFDSNCHTENLKQGSPLETTIHSENKYSYGSHQNTESTKPDISSPGGSNTILITTHNYNSSQNNCNKNNSSSSSSITIVTTHNSSGTTENGNSTSIKSSEKVDCISTSSYKTANGHNSSIDSALNSTPVVLEGINILINNHFNESKMSNPLPSTSKIFNIKSETIDIINQNKPTSEFNNSKMELKSEKNDIQTEPDSTTNGLSPDKSIQIHSSSSSLSSDLFSNSSSSSGCCTSNSGNSSCTSNEGSSGSFIHTNNNYKKQKNVNFKANMDVLVQRKDGKFYFGIIKDVYAVDGKCLINFGDCSECVADFDDIKRLKTESQNESIPMCVVCKNFNADDIVETCEKCSRGHHRLCMENGYRNGIWTCKMCLTRNGIKTPKKINLSIASKTLKETPHLKFAYDLKKLTWDNKHQINDEEVYCYCGKYGRWNTKMLQCLKCLQWFHDSCISSLHLHLLYGDRFFVFVCSVCNNGSEILRRLKFDWVDLVHLLIYNLTKLEKNKQYHHITKTIVPYAIKNWKKMHLSATMNKLSHIEIEKKIIHVLHNSSRFKSEKENKNRAAYWGLRTRLPPKVPKIVIPKGTTKITDQFLKSVLKLKFYSPEKKGEKSPILNYKRSLLIEENDSKSSSDQKFESEDEIPIKSIMEKEFVKKEESQSKLSSPMQVQVENSNLQTVKQEKLPLQQKEQSRRKRKYTFHPRLPNSSSSNDYQMNAINSNSTYSNNINFKKSSSNFALDLLNNLCCDSSDDNSSLGTLDIRIPPPKDFFGRNNPFRQITPKKQQTPLFNSTTKKNGSSIPSNVVTKLNFNEIDNKDVGIKDPNKSLDLSSKLVALKKSSLNLFNAGIPSDLQAAGQFRIVRTIKRRLSERDIVIGPNQEIKKRRLRKASVSNNCEVISTSIQSVSSKSKKNIIATYPAAGPFNFNSISSLKTSTMMNRPTTSHQISSSFASTPSTSNSHSASSSLLTDTNNLFRNLSTISVNNQNVTRNLRKRDDINYAENRRNSFTMHMNNFNQVNNNVNLNKNSTNDEELNNRNIKYEQSAEEEMSDLQSSVNMYFGAIERIKNGEKFIVRGRRTLENGLVQYLIDWEGCTQ